MLGMKYLRYAAFSEIEFKSIAWWNLILFASTKPDITKS